MHERKNESPAELGVAFDSDLTYASAKRQKHSTGVEPPTNVSQAISNEVAVGSSFAFALD